MSRDPPQPAVSRDTPPVIRMHGEVWQIVRGVGRGVIDVNDGVGRLAALTSRYLPPDASDGHAAYVGMRLVDVALGLPDGTPEYWRSTWRKQAGSPPEPHAAHRAAWYLVGYMSHVVPEPDVLAGERRFYDRLMEIAPKEIVIA